MLADFLRFCLHHGVGGFVLFALAGWAALCVVLPATLATWMCALDGVNWVTGRFGHRSRSTVAPLIPQPRADGT
jgi:hypothetical protein